ncbi:SDR family oxidoreductase [Umezawaea endophytica]|uniref:SDR family oxidoreductase n=1 Tax=Umezawaea endophytica TaxID=1654476 RepID=A0A9X2VX48_9PSEU|nr:SDR family oxidoreductase [Umezawaea endophytica]MCS7483744.1 SDR family oxidoreductase [Umezawaea endophytica]
MIEDKVVVITGASGGIGRATAVGLAARGAKLVLGGRTDKALDGVAREIRAAGGQAVAVVTDVTRRQDVQALLAAAVAEFGRVDVMVNNAGIGPVSALDELKVEEWDRMVDVNLKGVLHGIGAALPVFRRQGGGQFVTVGSVAGMAPTPTMAVYGATKTAVRVLCDGLRVESGPDVRVTLVSPGFVATDFVATVSDADVRAALEKSRDAMAISPDAIARAIVFAVDQPADVDVNEIVVRPTAQA